MQGPIKKLEVVEMLPELSTFIIYPYSDYSSRLLQIIVFYINIETEAVVMNILVGL